jgi:predicted GTPase
MIFLALLLPLLSLLPLGWLWLWQKGYALYWLAAAFGVGALAYGLQALALRKTADEATVEGPTQDGDAADPGWTARERAAWAAVERLAANVRPSELTDRDKVLNLGLRTIETVARHIHPQDRNPLWKFTLPEALALIERVSADLRPFVIDNIPLGDQLTVGQALKIYRWRSAIGLAEKAYDIWRLVRLINPVTAAAQEAREQITKHLYATVRDELANRLARGYVREVGRAAIDLYGGRLKVSPSELAEHISGPTLRDRSEGMARAEPLRILVAGQPGAGKSSLVNALGKDPQAPVDALPRTRRFMAHDLKLAGLAGSLVTDSPALGASAKEQRQFAAKAGEFDLILWALDIGRESDEIDGAALAAVRDFFDERAHRRQPPIIVALTHVDLASGAGNSEVEDARERAAARLEVALADVVPVSVATGRPAYNIEALIARIVARAPDAKWAQALRLMEDAAPRWSAWRLGKQASNAALSAARALVPSYVKRWTATRRG